MKRLLAGCLAAAMFCSGMAMAEAPGANSLREKINAAQATVAPETDAGFMIPEAVDVGDDFMIPQAVEEVVIEEEPVEAEAAQAHKPGSLMAQINAVKQGETASVGIIGGADGPTNIYVSVPEETEVEITVVPEADEAETVVPEGVQTRKAGSLMGQINAVKNGEAAAVEAIGGQDGPSVTAVAVPEIAENVASEPVPVEEEAPPAFVLRDVIGWHSTEEELAAMFEGYETDSYILNDLLLDIEAVEVYNVKVSLFEGDMFFYFHEGQLWAMGYYLNFMEGEAEKLLGSLTTKYGAPENGAETFMSIANPISKENMQVDADEWEAFYNWMTVQNTAVVYGADAYEGMLAYFNMDYVEELHAAVAADEFFGI